MASTKTKAKRVALGTVAVLFLGGMAYGGAMVEPRRLEPPPVRVEAVRAALEQPLDAPGAALPEVDRGLVTVVDGRARADVTVPPWQCLFARVGGATPKPFDEVSLFDTETREARVYDRDQRMVGLGWCATDTPVALTLWGTTPELSGGDLTEEGEGAMLYRFHVGPPEGDWRRYVVGTVGSEEPRAELTAAWSERIGEERDAAAAPPGEGLFRADVGPEEALALPLAEATRSVAGALPTAGRSAPIDEPRLIGPGGNGRGTARPVALVDERYYRLLAILDPSDLPVPGAVPCVTVHLTRLATDPGRPARLPIPALEASPGDQHRLCPGDPLTAFVADPDDGAEWRVRVVQADGPSAPRSPTAAPDDELVGPTFRRAFERCESGEAAGCAEASRYLATGRYVAADPERAKRLGDRACRAEAGHCGAYGSFLRDRGDTRGAVAAWRRGCEEGEDGWACATLGEAYRLGEGTAFDAERAKEAYEKACRLGVERACGRVRTLELLLLG